MKGYIYTLEVTIASFLIFTTIIYVFSTPITTRDYHLSLLEERTYNILSFLESSGILREYIHNGYRAQLEEKIKDLMPPGVEVHVEINSTCSYSSAPDYKDVILIKHYYTGLRSYEFKKLCVYVWESVE